jgi:hypothetical protein
MGKVRVQVGRWIDAVPEFPIDHASTDEADSPSPAAEEFLACDDDIPPHVQHTLFQEYAVFLVDRSVVHAHEGDLLVGSLQHAQDSLNRVGAHKVILAKGPRELTTAALDALDDVAVDAQVRSVAHVHYVAVCPL